jgi:A118 family predicted phage portal protein
MRISDTIKSTWLELFGKKLDRCLVEGDKMIQVWADIYAGRPEWQKYTTRGLFGQRTEWRFLLNAAKMITSELAGLVFAEEPNLTTDSDVLDILKENKFWTNLQSWLDIALALGNGALKWAIKDGKPIIDFVRATDYMPVSYDSRGVTEADFASGIVKDGKEYKIVEQHRKTDGGYTIALKAYKKSATGEYKECLADEAGVDETPTFIATTRPLFVIWRNPESNNIDLYSPLGISIYANAIDTIRQLDEAYDNLAHERNSTKRKIIIGSSMIKTVFDTAKTKQDVYYDRNDSVYVAFDDAEKQNMMPVDINFPFRIQEITADININLAILCKQCGLSDNFLSFNGASMKTATEVISENSKTFRTKKNIENSLTPAIVEFVSALKDIGAPYGIATTDADYNIKWDDSVLEDRGAKETRIINRYNAKLITLEDALMQLDGLTEEQADEKAKMIREANKTVDVGSLFGGNE